MSTPSEISVATPRDAETVTRLQIDFDTEFDSPTPPFEVLLRRYRALLEHPDAFVLLAGRAEQPSGFALITLRPTIYCDGPLAVLDELYVLPTLRDRGIGTQLLQRAIDEVLARGGGQMHINVDEIDTDTRRFYERHGFVNIEPGTDYRMLCYIRELEEF